METERLLALLVLTTAFLAFSCVKEKFEEPMESGFSLLPPESTGVTFSNDLAYDEEFNIYTYRNFYNGGGVAVGDFNNDGIVDIYLTANMLSNRLFIGNGDLTFEDITEEAGVAGAKSWCTGVTAADINGDGWLDLYVCNSGDRTGDNKQNELFINLGLNENNLPRFSEEAQKYNLADRGYGTHTAFFDYDRDGDLDAYLLNNSYRSIFDFNRMKNQRPVRDDLGGDKLFRNDDNFFTDVSQQAGIYGSEIGFGLGVTVADINLDGWMDIFVSNDFFERDYLYMNNGDGTFKEDLENQILSLSVASMGADIADINNDGFPEIFVTEMLPEDEARFKTKMTFESWDTYQYNVANGYYHQFTRNVLQLNNGDGTFSEIGRLAGVEATDWSWGALMCDFDNDGLKDLFVANGLFKDIIDQDYINFVSNEEIVRQVVTEEGVNYKKLIDTIPSTPIPNYLFKNQGNLNFKNRAREWGLAIPSHSNGAAYADLDNDGDMDLVINNVNDHAFIFRNDLDNQGNYIKIVLKGTLRNSYAIGSKVRVYLNDKTLYQELAPVRGFQSSVDYRLNFGVGEVIVIDSIKVVWPDNQASLMTEVAVNQTLFLDQSNTEVYHQDYTGLPSGNPLLKNITDEIEIDFIHRENRFVDFDRDRLIYHMVSTEGPKICVGDVNNDGLEDFFIGGAAGMPSALFMQNSDQTFRSTNERLFIPDAAHEDIDAIFFDADGDTDLDLYVCRGGNEFLLNPNLLVDQLYLNNGTGKFTRSAQFLPTFKPESSSCVRTSDYDQDGDSDLFVGIRITPGYYGMSTNGYILNNDGQGKFKNVTPIVAPDLEKIGMITDARWIDIDRDNDDDLVVVGEWMPITIFKNNGGKLEKIKDPVQGLRTEGWWHCIQPGDLDGDGDLDFVVGNHGINSRFRASQKQPVSIYINDFDKNGTPDPIITQYQGNKAYPTVLRHDLVMQLPMLKKKYPNYSLYKEQSIDDFFEKDLLRQSVHKETFLLHSSIFINDGDGRFTMEELPVSAQMSPAFGLMVRDITGDDHLDILLGGNLYGVKPEVGRYDASYGVFLKGNGDGSFESLSAKDSGFRSKGQIRDIAQISFGNRNLVLVAKNNDLLEIFEY